MPNPIYTIGHSNHPLEAFIALLERHRIEEVADVRTYPRSRYNPCFNRDALERALARRGVRCLFLGAELGGRPADPACYDETGRVRYDLLAETAPFRDGMRRLLEEANARRVAVMCSEKEPLKCHRTLLIAHALVAADDADGESILHILADGTLETHAAAMERLPAKQGGLEDAVRRQAAKSAYSGGPPRLPAAT